MDRKNVTRRTVLGGVAAAGAVAGLGTAAQATVSPAGETGSRRPAEDAGRQTRKVAVITGAGSGFGKLTALKLARSGHHVFATMRDPQRSNAAAARELTTTAKAEDLRLEVVEIDIRDDRSVEAGVRTIRATVARIDVLVNNAGIFYPAILETLPVSEVKEFFDTNVFGHLRMNRAVLPAMRSQGDGLVVQITTTLGRVVLPFLGAYTGAKWAMEAMTEVSRYEVSQFGVDVVIVEPGAYNTDLVVPNGVAHYQRHLRRLSPDNARRRKQYGDLARRAESHLVEEESPDPQQVANTIDQLVRMPRGERPVRTFGPGSPPHWAALNEAAEKVQRELLQFTGFDDLAVVKPR